MIVAAQPAGGRRWREADNDTVSNDGDRDQKESEVTVLLYYLFSFPLSFFIPCFFLSGFKNNLLVLVFFFYSPPLCSFSLFCLSFKTFVHLPKISSLPLLFHPLLCVFLRNLAPPLFLVLPLYL
jgi:hypothetical protein